MFGHVIYRPLYWRSDFQLAASQDAGFSARSSRFREDEATLMSSLSINVSTSTNGTISPSLKRWKICLRVFTLDRRLLTTTRREFQTCLFEKRENPPLWKLRVLTKGRILEQVQRALTNSNTDTHVSSRRSDDRISYSTTVEITLSLPFLRFEGDRRHAGVL